jgi:hypothetical protein
MATVGMVVIVVTGLCMPALAAVGHGKAAGLTAAVESYHYEYYRDVYGNGNWGWSSHGYTSFQSAKSEALRACKIGTRVRYIGKFDSNGNLIEQWVFRC